VLGMSVEPIGKWVAEDDGLIQPRADRRDAPRAALLLRAAKLVSETAEHLCILRDVSSGGAQIRLFHPLSPSSQLRLELANGTSFAVAVVWQREDTAGLAFDSPVEVMELIREAELHRKRPLRLRVHLPASIVVGEEFIPAVVRDLSQQGAQIDCDKHLAIDQQVRLEVRGMSAVPAKVRWRRPPSVGLVFEKVFRLDEFARLTAGLQQRSKRSV
jgi:hypothetical protein